MARSAAVHALSRAYSFKFDMHGMSLSTVPSLFRAATQDAKFPDRSYCSYVTIKVSVADLSLVLVMVLSRTHVVGSHYSVANGGLECIG